MSTPTAAALVVRCLAREADAGLFHPATMSVRSLEAGPVLTFISKALAGGFVVLLPATSTSKYDPVRHEFTFFEKPCGRRTTRKFTVAQPQGATAGALTLLTALGPLLTSSRKGARSVWEEARATHQAAILAGTKKLNRPCGLAMGGSVPWLTGRAGLQYVYRRSSYVHPQRAASVGGVVRGLQLGSSSVNLASLKRFVKSRTDTSKGGVAFAEGEAGTEEGLGRNRSRAGTRQRSRSGRRTLAARPFSVPPTVTLPAGMATALRVSPVAVHAPQRAEARAPAPAPAVRRPLRIAPSSSASVVTADSSSHDPVAIPGDAEAWGGYAPGPAYPSYYPSPQAQGMVGGAPYSPRGMVMVPMEPQAAFEWHQQQAAALQQAAAMQAAAMQAAAMQRHSAMMFYMSQQAAYAHQANKGTDLVAAASVAPPGFVPAMASDGSIIYVDARFVPGLQ